MVLSDGKFKIKKLSHLASEAGWLLPYSRRVMDGSPMGVGSTLMIYLLQKPSLSSIILGRGAHHVNLGTHQHSDSSVHVTIEKAHLSTKGRIFLGPSLVGQMVWFFVTVLQNN